MIEGHNIASRLIIKTLSEGEFGVYITYTRNGIGIQGFRGPVGATKLNFPCTCGLPQWLLLSLSADELLAHRLCAWSRLDQMIFC